MKVVKRVFVGIGIFLGLVLALAIIGVGYLFVVPSGSLFGYHLVTYNKDTYSSAHYLEDDATSIEISAGAYDIDLQVENSTDRYLSTQLVRDVTALLKTGEGDICTTFTYDRLTRRLMTSVYEPSGLKLRGEGKIIVKISSSILLDISSLYLKTTRGNMLVHGNNNININNLNLTTKYGSIELADVSLKGHLNANIGAGDLTAHSNTKINLTKTTIKTGSGQVNLNVQSTNYSFGNFEYNNTSTGYLYLPATNSLTYTGKGGKVFIEEIGQLDFNSKNTNLTINNITSGAYINMTGEGSVSINNCAGYSEIVTNSGNITINNSSAILSLTSTSGNIKVQNASVLVDATTKSGNIFISYPDSTNFYQQDSASRQALATTTSGKVELYGVDYVDVSVKSASGSVFVLFHDIASKQSKIQTQSANVYAQVPKGTPISGDTNGAPYIVRILSNKTPTISSGFGEVIHSEDNLFIVYAYDANTSTAAQLDIICVDGKATVTNGI